MFLLPKILFSFAMILCFGCAMAVGDNVIGDNVYQTEDKVAICHKGKTIYIDQAAVKAHLKHGDSMGTCQ
jgi:hypothetical protein